MTKVDLIESLKRLNVKYCFNEKQYDFEKLKYIVVGDNPGNTEYIENKFFIGPSGQELRKFFKENNLVKDFDNECIIFNKTFIHTTKTKDLGNIIPIIGNELFDKIQEICAKEISDISNRYKLPILIFGKSQVAENMLFDVFWKILNKHTLDKENILLFSHPAPPHFRLKEEWNLYQKEFEYNSPEILLKKIGSINTKIINNKYINHMKTRFFYGAGVNHQNGKSTWPKLFVLSEDGRFYCEYLDCMKPDIVDEKFEFNTFKIEDYKWGGYQTIVEIDKETAKNKILTKQSNWVDRYLNTLY